MRATILRDDGAAPVRGVADDKPEGPLSSNTRAADASHKIRCRDASTRGSRRRIATRRGGQPRSANDAGGGDVAAAPRPSQ